MFLITEFYSVQFEFIQILKMTRHQTFNHRRFWGNNGENYENLSRHSILIFKTNQNSNVEVLYDSFEIALNLVPRDCTRFDCERIRFVVFFRLSISHQKSHQMQHCTKITNKLTR